MDLDNGHEHYYNFMDNIDSSGIDTNSDESSDELDEHKYSEKKQLVALLLSIFLGEFGADRFYVGRYPSGFIKLLLPLILCCTVFCIFCIAGLITGGQALRGTLTNFDYRSQDNVTFWNSLTQAGGCIAAITTCLLPCGCCAWIIWIIVDIILFAINDITDEDGYELKPI